MEKQRIGFIGLGEMGKPMVKNLLEKGFEVTVCGHRRRGPVEELRFLGAVVADTPGDAARSSEVIITMVADIPETDEVFFGQGHWEGKGIWQGVKAGSTVIVCSTLLPGYCRKLEERGRERGIFLLDGPVSGGSTRAEKGDLTFMVGGNREVFDRCVNVFRAMGRTIFYIGGAGMGQAIKLVNNYMMVVTAHATSEAVRMGLKAGIGLDRMLEIIRVSSGNSTVIENWNMLVEDKKRGEDNEKGSMPLFHKDVRLAVEIARKLGVKSDFGELVLKSDGCTLFPIKAND